MDTEHKLTKKYDEAIKFKANPRQLRLKTETN